MKNYAFLDKKNIKADALSGLTVALALVPEAVAFAFVANVHPLVGLYAAFIVGLVTSLLGGRPGMISGATGALAVVIAALVIQHGPEYLFAAVVVMGLIQITAGILRLGKFIRLVPHPVMLGFVNGLAIVIFLAQLTQFKDSNGAWLSGDRLTLMLGLVAATMVIIHFLPKITTAIPSALAAIIIISLLVIGLGLPTPTVGDLASIAGGLPQFHIPAVPMTLDTLWIVLPYSVILAAVGLIESLLTLTLIDDITETKGNTAQECVGQGIANLITGFFGGMGGCAMIGQSMINIRSGGRNRLSGAVAALFLLIFILFASRYIELIPLAALVGVMFMVVIGTFAWPSLKILHRIPRADALVIVLVTAVTVATDLAIAVVAGVIVSSLVFAWNAARQVSARVDTSTDAQHTTYSLSGPLFFGSVANFNELFAPRTDADDVIIDFRNSRVWDHSGLEAIDALAERYRRHGKTLHLVHLSQDCRHLLRKSADLVEVNVIEDPQYGVATDYSRHYHNDLPEAVRANKAAR